MLFLRTKIITFWLLLPLQNANTNFNIMLQYKAWKYSSSYSLDSMDDLGSKISITDVKTRN